MASSPKIDVLPSAEAEELIAKGPLPRDGLRELAKLLPADDEKLERWLGNSTTDPGTFAHLFCAAAISGRKIRVWNLSWAIASGTRAWHIGWVAWRAEEDATENLLHGLKIAKVAAETEAFVLVIAAMCWQKQHAGEEVPRQIMRAATELSHQKLDLETITLLRILGLVAGDDNFLIEVKNTLQKKQLKRDIARNRDYILGSFEGPFEKLISERKINDFVSVAPQLRAVEKMGRNESCRCGSGKKYKNCCAKKDRERLSRSSPMAGVTQDEFATSPDLPLTESRLRLMRAEALSNLDARSVPVELQAKYLLRLAELKQLDEAVGALQSLARDNDGKYCLPEHLREAWGQMFTHALDAWRPNIAKDLMEIFPDAEEKLGQKPHAGIRLLMTGHDLTKGTVELLDSIDGLLKSGDLEELEKLTWTLLKSPYYQGLGILLARGLLPLVDEKSAPGLFEGILAARAKLNLPPEDEFSDWMDQQALRKSQKHETAAAQEAQDKLTAKMAEVRRAKEALAQVERELKLHTRKEQREAESKPTPTADEEAARRNAKLEADKKRLKAEVSQKNEERRALWKKLEEVERENEALKAKASASEPKETDDEDFHVEGSQPVRLLKFPEGFKETLASYPGHVGRATMNRLGRIASGEPGAFEKVKQLKAYPDVLRARVSDKYRLLFCLTPDHVRVVDLIRRADLDRRIERLQTSGLPPVR